MAQELCPICGTELRSGFCRSCGYDESADFLAFRTLQPVCRMDLLTRWTCYAGREIQKDTWTPSLNEKKLIGQLSEKRESGDQQKNPERKTDPIHDRMLANSQKASGYWTCECGYRGNRIMCPNCFRSRPGHESVKTKQESSNASQDRTSAEPQADISGKKTWTCRCGYLNDISRRFCENCDAPSRIAEAQTKGRNYSAAGSRWLCSCGAWNENEHRFCRKCDRPRR